MVLYVISIMKDIIKEQQRQKSTDQKERFGGHSASFLFLRKICISYYETYYIFTTRRQNMNYENEVRRLEVKIHLFEDMMFRSKQDWEINRLHDEIVNMRNQLGKIKRMELRFES